MFRSLMLAGLMTLSGAAVSQAQYQDSSPPEGDEYETEYYDDYDEELLGSPDYQDEYRGDRGYSEPGVEVGIFAELGYDGRWHFAASYGWVWQPCAASGWRPYSNGHWVWTRYGWTWVSYEPFGWATYHYGSWVNDFSLGWVWIPAYEWSACRVQWAVYDNYVCWAPLPPPGVRCPSPWSASGYNVWFSVEARHFTSHHVARYCERPRYKSAYAAQAVYRSPERRFVERHSGQPVRTASVDFKHRTTDRHDVKRATSFSSRTTPRASGKQRAYRPEARESWTSKGGGQSEKKIAMKTSPRVSESRQVRPETSSRKQPGYRQGQTVRKQSAVQQPRSAQQRSKAQYSSKRSSGERKSANMSSKSSSSSSRERKTVARESGSSKRSVAKSAKGKGSEAHGGRNRASK